MGTEIFALLPVIVPNRPNAWPPELFAAARASSIGAAIAELPHMIQIRRKLAAILVKHNLDSFFIAHAALYHLLDFIDFFGTAGENVIRKWVHQKSSYPLSCRRIHKDLRILRGLCFEVLQEP